MIFFGLSSDINLALSKPSPVLDPVITMIYPSRLGVYVFFPPADHFLMPNKLPKPITLPTTALDVIFYIFYKKQIT